MGDQVAVLVLTRQDDLASEGLWHKDRLSLENTMLDCLMLVLMKKLWSPFGDCAMSWTML